MASPDEVIAETFAALDRHLRRASIAEVGGFRPPDDPIASYFGGRFVGRRRRNVAAERWPADDPPPAGPHR
jgi:hypothetical protein